MRRFRLALSAGLLAAVPGALAADGPSFDCAKAEGAVETLICADPGLAAQDRALAETYAAAAERVAADPEQAATLRAEQRGWIKGRNDCWKAGDVRACVAALQTDRIAELSAAYGLVASGETGVWNCGGETLHATPLETDPPAMNLVRGEEVVTALLRRSGSSARYEGPFGTVFRTKGDEAVLEWPQGVETTCGYEGPYGE